jgi:hypothetical protein
MGHRAWGAWASPDWTACCQWTTRGLLSIHTPPLPVLPLPLPLPLPLLLLLLRRRLLACGRRRQKRGARQQGLWGKGQVHGVRAAETLPQCLCLSYVSIHQHTSAYVSIRACSVGLARRRRQSACVCVETRMRTDIYEYEDRYIGTWGQIYRSMRIDFIGV